MALLSTPSTSFLRIKIPTLHVHHRHFLPSFSLFLPRHSPSSSSLRLFALSSSSSVPDEWGEKSGSGLEQEPESKFAGPDSSTPEDEDQWGPDKEPNKSGSMAAAIPDEWGEKSGSVPEQEPESKFAGPDPSTLEDEDEWGPDKEPNKSRSKAAAIPDEWGEESGSGPEQEPESKFAGPDPSTLEIEDEWGPDKEPNKSRSKAAAIPDEWGEKSGPEPELESAYTRFTAPDPAIREDEDEWGPDERSGNGGSGAKVEEVEDEDKGRGNWELKKCLVDTVYGSEFGLRTSTEVRAQASELVTQLEAANPTPNPAETPTLLDGNWVLLYTAASELLPLLAVGSTPLLKVEQISQAIDTANRTIENSTALAGPLASCSFTATATFEVRTPSRIQFQFKEATFKPPEIKSQIDVPESVDIFGQRISLSPVQQLMNPLQGAAASVSRTLSGLPPLKIPLPSERTESWLLITYLDEDLWISRGDGGGLFVLVREGSPLLEK